MEAARGSTDAAAHGFGTLLTDMVSVTQKCVIAIMFKPERQAPKHCRSLGQNSFPVRPKTTGEFSLAGRKTRFQDGTKVPELEQNIFF